VVVWHLALVKPVEGDLLAVRRPPHRGALLQFLAVDPAGCAVFNAGFVVAVRGDGHFVASLGVAQPEVAVPVKRLELAVRRGGGSELPAALPPPRRVAPRRIPPGRPGPRTTRGRLAFADGPRLAGGDVVAISFAVLLIFEGLAVVLPGHEE